MSNLDLTIVEIMHGDTEVLKIMKGDVQKWISVTEEEQVIVSSDSVVIGTSYNGLQCSSNNVTWSVSSNTYALINASTGVLTINSNAWGNSVTVRATSNADNTNYDEVTITLFYNSSESKTFSAYSIIDISSSLRNGSAGNTSNAVRVGDSNTRAIGTYTHVLFNTTRPNVSGYSYYGTVKLYTIDGNSTTGNATSNNNDVCELGQRTIDGNLHHWSLHKLFPLWEDTTFEGGYEANHKTGSTPKSFAYTIQEGTSSAYNSTRTLRIEQFSGYTTKVVLFK